MAEAFGIAAGIAGFISLTIQVRKGVKALHEIRASVDKAPAALADLQCELALLENLMDLASSTFKDESHFVLEACSRSCQIVVNHLNDLESTITIVPWESRTQRAKKILALRHWEKDVDVLRRSISNAKDNLQIAFQCHSSKVLTESVEMLAEQRSSFDELKSLILQDQSNRYPSKDDEAVEGPSRDEDASRGMAYLDCSKRQCSCSCHSTTSLGGRFWFLDYTPLSTTYQSCSNKSCTATMYRIKFRLSLTQYNIPYAAIFQWYLSASQGKILMGRTLEVERVVRYTSPGFAAIWKWQRGLISFDDAKADLTALYHEDPSLKNHVDPSGRTYLDKLMECYSTNDHIASTIPAFLNLLIKEFGMIRGMRDKRLLIACAAWQNNLSTIILKKLLDLGLDTTLFDAPQSTEWKGFARQGDVDRFQINFQALLLKDNPGFADTSPLQLAVLHGSLTSARRWIGHRTSQHTNFLGQTTVHLAVGKPQILKLLIQSGHSADATDMYGFTPLKYAVILKEEESVFVLLEAGAHESYKNCQASKDFLALAADVGNWSLILKILFWLKTSQQDDFEYWIQRVVILFFFKKFWGGDQHTAREILSMWAPYGRINTKFSFYDGKADHTLLYDAKSVSDIELLLEFGFAAVAATDSLGRTALHRAVTWTGEHDRFQKFLDIGVPLESTDHAGFTVLFETAASLQEYHTRSMINTIGQIRILLKNGVNTSCHDACICPCSVGGCLPISLLKHTVFRNSGRYFDIPLPCLEWLQTIQDLRGESAAKETILNILRRVEFDQLGLTHVCCRPESSTHLYKSKKATERHTILQSDDLEEILDEESEFIEILDRKMSQYQQESYNDLLQTFLLHIKSSLQPLRNIKIPGNTPPSPRPVINEKIDDFICTYSWRSDWALLSEIIKSIAKYVTMLLSEHNESTLFRGSHELSCKDEWFSTRIELVRTLCGVLEIPLGDVVKEMWHSWSAPSSKTVWWREAIARLSSTWEIDTSTQ